MKKLLSLVMCLVFVAVFVACGVTDETQSKSSSDGESNLSETANTSSKTESVPAEKDKVTEEYITMPDGFDFSKWQLKVNGKLYYGTAEEGPMGDSGSVEGRIIGTVAEGETPTEDGYSNFGAVGGGYTYDDNGSIQVFTPEGFWRYFKVR